MTSTVRTVSTCSAPIKQTRLTQTQAGAAALSLRPVTLRHVIALDSSLYFVCALADVTLGTFGRRLRVIVLCGAGLSSSGRRRRLRRTLVDGFNL